MQLLRLLADHGTDQRYKVQPVVSYELDASVKRPALREELKLPLEWGKGVKDRVAVDETLPVDGSSIRVNPALLEAVRESYAPDTPSSQLPIFFAVANHNYTHVALVIYVRGILYSCGYGYLPPSEYKAREVEGPALATNVAEHLRTFPLLGDRLAKLAESKRSEIAAAVGERTTLEAAGALYTPDKTVDIYGKTRGGKDYDYNIVDVGLFKLGHLKRLELFISRNRGTIVGEAERKDGSWHVDGMVLPLTMIYTYTSGQANARLVRSNCTSFLAFILNERLDCTKRLRLNVGGYKLAVPTGVQDPRSCRSIVGEVRPGDVIAQLLRRQQAPFPRDQFNYLDFGAPIFTAETLQASEQGRALVLKHTADRVAEQEKHLEEERRLQAAGEQASLEAARKQRLSSAAAACGIGTICRFLLRLGGGGARKTRRLRRSQSLALE
jgi:hypothetical protein